MGTFNHIFNRIFVNNVNTVVVDGIVAFVSVDTYNVNIVESIFISFYHYLMLVLILSGDVELNPGPVTHYSKKNCKILYSNIRGLRSNFLDLQSCARNYDLLFLSETLVSSNRSKVEFLIPGFDGPDFIYRRNIPHAQGMAVYSKSGRPIYRQKNLECSCHEVLCFKIFSKFYNIYAFAVYRNPNIDDSIYDCLLEKINMAQSLDSKASFVVCGDCNAKHSEWLNSNSTDQHGQSALEFCVSSDFVHSC